MSGVWDRLRRRMVGGTDPRMKQPPVSPCQCNDAEEPPARPGRTRREFLAWVGAGLIGLAGAAASVPLVGAFFSTPPRREQIWHTVGTVDDFPVDETVKVEFSDPDAVPWAGPAAQNAAWLRRTGEESFTCFSIYCTHTGCPVSWRSGANLFICPCHGGVFDREGDVVAGPPETPLVRLDVRLRDEQVEILATPVPVTGRAS